MNTGGLSAGASDDAPQESAPPPFPSIIRGRSEWVCCGREGDHAPNCGSLHPWRPIIVCFAIAGALIVLALTVGAVVGATNG